MTKPLFTAAQLAQLTQGPDLDADAARLRVKSLVAQRYIVTRVRSETDKRGTLLFSAGDAMIAAILSAIVDLGLSSKPMMQAAAVRLHAWQIGEDGPKRPESPAQWMADVLADDLGTPPGFGLRIGWQRHVSGTINIFAAISHGDNGELGNGIQIRKDHTPVADLLIPLDPILLKTHARMERLKVAH